MNAAVPVAIVGAGRMGAFHARALTRVDEVEVVALADPDPHTARLAEELGVAITVASVDDLIASQVAEAWIVAAPTHLHPSIVANALDHEIPVLCEKPLSLDLAVGMALEQRVGDLILQVGFWRRFSPPWALAKAAIDQGDIGRPLMLRLSQWDADPPPAAFCDPAVSGGLAVDCGIHEFDLIEWLTGRTVTRVLARPLPVVDESLAVVGDVDNLVVLLELDDGAVATVDLSRNARYADDVRTEVLGSNGALFVEMLPAGRLRIGGPDGIKRLVEADAEDAMAAGVAEQARAFVRRIKGGNGLVPGAGEANRALAIALAARESADRGTWVGLAGALSG